MNIESVGKLTNSASILVFAGGIRPEGKILKFACCAPKKEKHSTRLFGHPF